MKPYKRGGFGNFDMSASSIFSSDLILKDGFPKNYIFDINTIIAYTLNPDLKKYIDSLTEVKGKLHFTTKFTKKGFVFIKADNKTKEYIFNKFNF